MIFFNKLKNAILNKKNCVIVNYTRKSYFTLKLLIQYRYINGFVLYTKKDSIYKENFYIIIFLKYKGSWIKTSAILIIKQISKPGQQIFITYKKLIVTVKNLKYHFGLGILSSSIGFISAHKAFLYKIGGEYLYYFN